MKKSVLAVALTLAGSPYAMAQATPETPAAAAPVQKVIVTGSNIKRAVDSETSSPVVVVNHEEIVAIGASTVKDVLDTLTSNTGALSDLGGSNSFASGASGVSLRNLGKNSTLTLLNGRRVSNFALADGGQETFVNIDSMPAEIIDRVEILLDGASAVYGSDAVGGVINIITKQEFRGATVKAGLRQSLLNGNLNKDQTASITGGHGDLNVDGYNVFGNFEAFHRSPYSDRAIEGAVAPWYIEYVNPAFGVKSTYSNPGNYVDKYPAVYPTNPALAGKSFSTPAPGCTTIDAGLCKFDQYDRLGIHAEAKRYNFFGGGRMKLSGGTQAFAEVTYSDVTTTYFNPPPIMQYTGASSSWYSSKEGKLKFYTEPKLPVGHPYNPYNFPVVLRYRYSDDVSIFKGDAHATQYRVMVGLEGSTAGWDWNTAFGTMGSKANDDSRGSKHAVNYLNAILSGEYKFGQVNSPELLLRMFPVITFGGKSSQTFVDAKATRELSQLPGGPLSLAVGADFRTDSFNSYVSDNVANAEIVGYGSIAVDGSRHISAAFAELNAPVTKALEFNGALRVDKVGQTETSIVPKLGARLELTKSFMIRGTLSNSFRAPNAAETGHVSLSAFNNGVEDPKRCATANAIYAALQKGGALDKADANTARALGCSESFAVSVQGNPALAPEKAKIYNFGFVADLAKDVSLTVDYFHIERRNEISTKPVSQILSNEDLVPGSVNRQAITPQDLDLAARAKAITGTTYTWAVGPISSLNKRYENLSKTRVSGIDVELNSKWNLGSMGKLSSNLKATYNLDLRGWDNNEDDYTENLVGTYANYKYVLRAGTNWSRGPWAAGVVLNYVPGTRLASDKYDDNYSPEGCDAQGIPTEYCKLDRDYTVDYHMSYAAGKQSMLYFNVDNLLDKAPNVDVRAGNPPLRGRTLRVAYEYKF
ncbi:MAG: TonB-dependent receptor [Pseudomonadota bacterium]